MEALNALPKYCRDALSGLHILGATFHQSYFTKVNKANSAENLMTDSKHLSVQVRNQVSTRTYIKNKANKQKLNKINTLQTSFNYFSYQTDARCRTAFFAFF